MRRSILEKANMASPRPETETQAERETQPESGGVFIRYATIRDIEEIKTRFDRQDIRMDRRDAKLDRLDAKLDKLNARLLGFMVALLIAVIITIIRSFF